MKLIEFLMRMSKRTNELIKNRKLTVFFQQCEKIVWCKCVCVCDCLCVCVCLCVSVCVYVSVWDYARCEKMQAGAGDSIVSGKVQQKSLNNISWLSQYNINVSSK